LGKKKTTEEYKLELEVINKERGTNLKLKDGVEYIKSGIAITHICTCGKEWDVTPNNILSGNSTKCGLCYPFALWGLDNIGKDFLDKYWDWEKNDELGINPWEISYSVDKDVYIFCQEKDYHGSYKTQPSHFIKGNRCSYCKGINNVHPKDSFAQYIIDKYGKNSLELYWDHEKNTIDPFTITKQSNRKVYIFCQEKSYHGSYPIRCPDFVSGDRCGYCNSRGIKIHPLDSLGKILEDKGLLHIWSDKNEKSPYEFMPYSNEYAYFKCLNNKHDDFRVLICSATNCNFRCPDCSYERMESEMATTLKQVLKYEYPYTIWEHDVGFKTPKNYISRYDIFAPQLNNLLIECQSEYHDDPEKQEIDRLKKKYALDNGYNYLALDKRDYTPLEAIQVFFPDMKEIPDYVDLLRNTLRDWDLKEAQELLNKGHTYQEVADIVGATYSAIRHNIGRGKLIKPENYIPAKPERPIKLIACLNKKDNSLFKIFDSLTEASNFTGCKTHISSVLNGKRKSAYGYKWMYYNEYIELNGDIKENINI